MRECKRCLLREASLDAVYEDIKARIEKLSENDKADETLYSSRLEKCKECEHLLSGVCQKCGCYIEFRAAFKQQHCPLTKSNKKW